MIEDRQAQAESFAVYLAKVYIAQKGYRAETAPEARALLDASDIVLTRADGMSFHMVCLIDREANPSRRFEMSKEALEEIGQACLAYTGSMNGAKLPVSITIVEVGAGAITEEQAARLSALKKRPRPFSAKSKVHIGAWALDTVHGAVWTNAAFNGALAGRSFLRRLMQSPRIGAEKLRPQEHAVMVEPAPPYLTYALLAVIAAVFLCEEIFGIEPGTGLLEPSVSTIAALGAVDKTSVFEHGEWWRLFSAPLLHGGPIHLLFNGVALFFAGAVLENVIGRAWFGAIFAVSAVCGAIFSALINPPAIVSVGASGAIMGLFAAALVCSRHFPNASPVRTQLQTGSLQVLIPSLLPLWGAVSGQKVDFAAHIGGAIGGALAGLLILSIWRSDSPFPSFRKIATALALLGLGGALFAFNAVAGNYETYALSLALIPQAELSSEEAAKTQSASLVARYPRDPRAHAFRALALIEAQDRPGAERELQEALAALNVTRAFFKPEFESWIRVLLASVMADNGELDKARAVAQPVCKSQSEYKEALAKERLCP